LNIEGFEWDDDKAVVNAGKHGVEFTEAASVFSDQYAITVFDKRHSQTEENLPRLVCQVSVD